MARLSIPDEPTFAEFTVTTSTSAFPITFSIFAKADITVLVDEEELSQSAFTFSGTLLDGGGYDGGTVTLNTAVDDVTVRIERNVAVARTSNFAPSNSVPVGNVDQALNRLTANVQDQKRREETNRAYLDAAIEEAGSAVGLIGKADKDGGNVTEAASFRENILAAAQAVVGVNMADVGTPNDITVDNTAAFNAALLVTPVVQFTQDEFFGNYVLDSSAQGIRGQIGEGETGLGGVNGLRPFDITKPTVTVGGGDSPVFNATIRDILISGHKATGQEAPAALRLTAGVSHFFASNIELIGGTVSLDCLPADGEPVTCSGIDQVHIRCDIAGSDARAIKFTRTGSDGEYFTGFSMHQGHVNGPNGAGSYALEIDGSVVGITASFVDVYFDCKPGKGVLLKGSSLLLGFNCQLDPGTNSVVVVKTDQTSRDPADSLSGNIRHGQQYLENGLSQQTLIPADVEWFFRFPCISNPYVGGQLFINTDASDRFSQTVYLTAVSAGGPVGLYGAPLRAMDTTQSTSLTAAALQTQGGLSVAKDIRVGGTWYGYSGATVAMTQEPSGAGWRWDITQAGGGFRFTPGSGGYVIIAGAGAYASADNAQTLGLNGNAWSNVVSKQYSIDGSVVIDSNRLHRLRSYTVATLPANVAGATAYVSDATAPTFLGALTGGGSVVCPVFNNGSAWLAA